VLNQQHIGSLTTSDEFGLRKRAAVNFKQFWYSQSTRPNDMGQFFGAVDEDSAHDIRSSHKADRDYRCYAARNAVQGIEHG
jgi:hypothetical protein